MRVIDVKELFQRCIGLEYELIKYVYRTQGEASAPLNFNEAAIALSAERKDVLCAYKRLLKAGALVAVGENIKIDEGVFKKQNAGLDGQR